MAKLTELTQKQTKTFNFNDWIEIVVKTRFSLEDQQKFMTLLNDNKWKEVSHILDLAFNLVDSWNIEDDNWNILPLELETFSKLPLSISNMNEIISWSWVFEINIDKEKKNTSDS